MAFREAAMQGYLSRLLIASSLCGYLVAGVPGAEIIVGQRYRIKLARAFYAQPPGWYLDAHRTYAGDVKTTVETQVIARREETAYWAGEWVFEKGTSDDQYKLKLVSNHRNQKSGWYLDTRRNGQTQLEFRTGSSVSRSASYVLVRNISATAASDWEIVKGASVTIDGKPQQAYQLKQVATRMYLAAYRELATDNRTDDSTYAIVDQRVDPAGITDWLFEPITCNPQCGYHRKNGVCYLSRPYTADVFAALQEDNWTDIAEHLKKCEAAGKSGEVQCRATPGCDTDALYRCSASHAWSMATLAALPADIGVGVGDYHRCGLFGQFVNLSAFCLNFTSRPACDAHNTSKCTWNARKQVCDISSFGLSTFLRRDYRDELAFVSLKRERCAKNVANTCQGDCQWQGGRCVLRPLIALLAIFGQSCPASTLFRRLADCRDSASNETCEAVAGPDGLAQCRWNGRQCEAYAVSLELDIVPALGLNTLVQTKMSTGEQECRSLTDEQACLARCSPPIPVAKGSAASQQAPSLLAFSFIAVLSLMASAALPRGSLGR